MSTRPLKYRKGNNAPPNQDRVVLIFQRGTWMDHASCRGADVDLFYDADDERTDARIARLTAAKEMCFSCAVQPECLATALANSEPYGVWGGFTAAERHQIAREGITATDIA